MFMSKTISSNSSLKNPTRSKALLDAPRWDKKQIMTTKQELTSRLMSLNSSMRLMGKDVQRQHKRLQRRSNAFVFTVSAARVKLRANNVTRVGKVTIAMCHVLLRKHLSIRIRTGTTLKTGFTGHSKYRIRDSLAVPARKHQRKSVGALVQARDLRGRESKQVRASLRVHQLHQQTTIWHQRRSKGNSQLQVPWLLRSQKFSQHDQHHLESQILQDGVQR